MEIRTPARSSRYYLPKQRFLTTYHYVMQYREWKDELESMGAPDVSAAQYDGMPHGSSTGDRTSCEAIRRVELLDKIKLVEETVKEADQEIYKWLLKGVTENVPFKYLQTMMGIPCAHNRYYLSRRRFYWLMAGKI